MILYQKLLSLLIVLIIGSIGCGQNFSSDIHNRDHFIEFFGQDTFAKVKILDGHCYHGMDDSVFLLFSISESEFAKINNDFKSSPYESTMKKYFQEKYGPELENLPTFRKDLPGSTLMLLWDPKNSKVYLNFQGTLKSSLSPNYSSI